MRTRQDGEVPVIVVDGLDLSFLSDRDRPYAENYIRFVRMGRAYGKADEEGFRPVHATTARLVWGQKRYPRLLDLLKRHGVVEVNPSYRPGLRSKSHRLAEPYRDARFRTEFRFLPELVANTKKTRNAVTYQTHLRLLEAYDRLTLADGWEADLPGDERDADQQRDLMLAIGRGHHGASCDEFGLRLHHSFARLKSDLRRHVLLDGERMSELDLRNCQPLMLGLDLLAWAAAGRRWEDVTGSADRLAGPYAADPISGIVGHVDPVTLEIVRGSGRTALDEDAAWWVRLCEAGRIYEEFQKELRWTRAKAKHETMIFLFGEYRHVRAEFREYLADYFPTVLEYVERCRSRKGHAFLAERLQRAESRTVYAGVVRRLQESDPDLPLLTVHDAFFCRPEDVGRVEGAVREEFARVGLSPLLKVGPG